jgi:cysteine-rich repeat protein
VRISFVVAVAVATLALAADHPVAGDKLVLKDPASNVSRRTFKFKATRDTGIDPATGGDPRALGATLEVTGRGAGDGTSGVVVLDAPRWQGLGEPPGAKGYKWLDASATLGVRKVFFKPGPTGGLLTVAGRGAGWSYAVTQAQTGPVDVRFGIGADVWCARFAATTFQESVAGKLRAALAIAPADCAVPPTAACGDGSVGGTEECDDGNTTGGDGCSAGCELETAAALCAGVPAVTGTALDAVAIATGLARPTAIAAPRLDPSRLFVVEQIGRIRLVKNGTLLPAPFLDIQAKTATTCPYSERGLLGLAFDPDYETNGRFYVNYTNIAGDTVIARYTVTGDPKTSDDADETSETILRAIAQPYSNHNGGDLHFGPDGFLYAGMGDGGSSCDPEARAQDDAQLLGKMLRFDPNAAAPANPTDDVWAKGLRNPWRFSFDRANGDLYIGDVGQNQREEVDVVAAPVPAGLDYGWDYYEGDQCSATLSCPGTFCPASTAGYTMPVVVYDHAQGCSITGGYVYRGCALPDLRGTYFYSDYCGAFMRTFAFSGGVATNQQDRTADVDPAGADTITGVTAFGEDARGEMYVAEQGACASATGTVYKLVPQP